MTLARSEKNFTLAIEIYLHPNLKNIITPELIIDFYPTIRIFCTSLSI